MLPTSICGVATAFYPSVADHPGLFLDGHSAKAIWKHLVREEVEAGEKRLSTKISKVQQTLSTKIDKVQQSVDIVQNVMVEHYTKLENCVTQLEADSEFPKSH